MRVIVIGAGLLGTSTAYFLARHGHAVVVLERADDVASETSHANGGIIHASNAAPWNAPGVWRQLLTRSWRPEAPLKVHPRALPGLTRWGLDFLRHSRRDRFERSLRANAALAVYSQRVLRGLRERAGLRYHGVQNGCLAVFRDPAALDEARHEAAILADAGVRSQFLEAAEVRAREPRLAGDFAGGLFYPEDESGDARLYTENLAALARAQGAEFRLGVTVTRLRADRPGRPAVDTDRGPIEADACVLAAGSHSVALARPLGLKLPIRPIKGHSVTLPLAADDPAPQTPVIDAGRKIVAARLGDQLRIAGFAEFAGYDDRPDHRRTAVLLRGAAELFPDLAARLDPAALTPWAGLRPTTADGRPLLGPTPVPGLFLATGTGHLGWTFAAGAGRLVADTVTGATPALDLDELGYPRLSG